MTADHDRQTHEYALHTFGGQSERRDRGNLTGGQALPMAQPKNRALSFLVLACGNQPQSLVNLLELETLAHDGKAVRRRGRRVVLDGIHDRFCLACPPFHGERGLEMIVDYIGRNHFQESINGIFLSRLEGAQ